MHTRRFAIQRCIYSDVHQHPVHISSCHCPYPSCEPLRQKIAEPANVWEREMELQAKHSMEYIRAQNKREPATEADVCVGRVKNFFSLLIFSVAFCSIIFTVDFPSPFAHRMRNTFAWRETNETYVTFASIIIQRCSFTNVEKLIGGWRKKKNEITHQVCARYLWRCHIKKDKNERRNRTIEQLLRALKLKLRRAGGFLVYFSLIFSFSRTKEYYVSSCEISSSWTNVIYLCMNRHKHLYMQPLRLSEHVFQTIPSISIDIRKHVIFALHKLVLWDG